MRRGALENYIKAVLTPVYAVNNVNFDLSEVSALAVRRQICKHYVYAVFRFLNLVFKALRVQSRGSAVKIVLSAVVFFEHGGIAVYGKPRAVYSAGGSADCFAVIAALIYLFVNGAKRNRLPLSVFVGDDNFAYARAERRQP